MSDLISRSDVLELQRYSFGVSMLNSEEYIKVSDVDNILTAYDIDKVVEEFDKKYNNSLWIKGNEEFSITRNELIEIVKQGGVSDDVCEWKAGKSNDEWQPNCEPNSTYNVFGVAWFRKCPYCGKKIKVVE